MLDSDHGSREASCSEASVSNIPSISYPLRQAIDPYNRQWLSGPTLLIGLLSLVVISHALYQFSLGLLETMDRPFDSSIFGKLYAILLALNVSLVWVFILGSLVVLPREETSALPSKPSILDFLWPGLISRRGQAWIYRFACYMVVAIFVVISTAFIWLWELGVIDIFVLSRLKDNLHYYKK